MRRITQALMQMQHRGRDAWIREKQFQLVTHMQRSWRREMIDARMYQALAVRERIAFRQSVLLALASAAERRAARWATRLRRRGVRLPTNNAPTLWEALRCWWAVRLGSTYTLNRIERRCIVDETWYVHYYLTMIYTASREALPEKRAHKMGM